MKEYIPSIIAIIAIITLIWNTLILLRGETIIYVNANNQELVNKCLMAEGENIYGVKKIGVRREWGKQCMYAYYSLGRKVDIYVRVDCTREASELSSYVLTNGYKPAPKETFLVIISIISIVIVKSYKDKLV